MDSHRPRPKARRRRFNQEHILRAASNLELQPGANRDMQLRPFLSLSTLRSSVHDDLRIMRATTVLSLVLTGLYIAVATMESEARYRDEDWSLSNEVRCAAATLAVIQVTLSVVYYRASLRIRKLRGLAYQGTTLISDSSFPYLLLEAAMLLLVVPPFVSFRLHFREVNSDSMLPFADLMLALACMRAVFTCRGWYVLSHLLEQRETFICDLHMLKRGRFIMRCILQEHPFLFLSLTVSSCAGLSGILVRVFDRSVATATVRSFYDSVWIIAYTQCTIGYGDVTSVTHFGRVLCVCAGVSGVLTLSLLVSTLVGWTSLSVREKVFLTALYSKHTSRTRLYRLAVVLLQRWWRYTLARLQGRKRFFLLGKKVTASFRFRARLNQLVSKENPEVDELIHSAKERIGEDFSDSSQRLRELKVFSRQMASVSTHMALLMTKFMSMRQSAGRAAKMSTVFKRHMASRGFKRTWTKAARSSLIANKRFKDSAYKKMLSQITEREKPGLTHCLSDQQRISIAASEHQHGTSVTTTEL